MSEENGYYVNRTFQTARYLGHEIPVVVSLVFAPLLAEFVFIVSKENGDIIASFSLPHPMFREAVSDWNEARCHLDNQQLSTFVSFVYPQHESQSHTLRSKLQIDTNSEAEYFFISLFVVDMAGHEVFMFTTALPLSVAMQIQYECLLGMNDTGSRLFHAN